MKRFYTRAEAVEVEGGWIVHLDGRPIMTQGGRPQRVPSAALGEALADEWTAQGEKLDPRSFRMRDLADYALDVVAKDRDAAVSNLLRYAETDTLCYHADPDEPLWHRQREVWEPLLKVCEAREGIKLQRISGVMHRAHDAAALTALRARLESLDAFTLASLTTLASLSASLVVGLAALEPDADGEALWDAANLEEDWQAELWGRDWETEERRDKRKGDFLAAVAFAGAARSRG